MKQKFAHFLSKKRPIIDILEKIFDSALDILNIIWYNVLRILLEVLLCEFWFVVVEQQVM